MRRILISGVLLAAAAAFVVLTTGASKGSAAGTYRIEFDNAFGLVTGANFEVSGVPAGTISAIGLDPRNNNAVVTVKVTKPGFGQFHSDVSCESRPESLIGEYYVDCNPGSSGRVIRPGSTIPVTDTRSTIPADLLQNIMRLPYRQRLTIIINELGAGAAARGGDIQAALRRAVPALTETDALLHLLGNDSATLKSLTRDSNRVITALADNSANVKRFIAEADRTAVATASQQRNLRTTLARLPGLLEQLRPTLAQLRTTMITNQPVLENLHQASGEINRLFTDLPAFSRSARPAIRSLGQASVTGKVAVTAARPTVKDLNAFAKPTPELAGNLAIVGHDLDTQSRAVEPDPRSPGGKGFSGLQALLWYVFNQTLAVNTFGPLGHMLTVDAFFSPMCSPYATPATVALMLKQHGSAYRQCYSWLGPNQPGVNETDPSNPNAPVPDPGGAPPGKPGPRTSAARLTAAEVRAARASAAGAARTARTAHAATASRTTTASSTTTSSHTATTSTTPAVPGAPPINLKASVGQILAGTVGGGSASTPASSPAGSGSASTPASSSAGSGGGGSGSTAQAQQLLNYLLAP